MSSILEIMAKKQADIFVNNNEMYFRCLPVLDVPKENLEDYYNVLVRTGRLVKMEDLPVKEKNGIWEIAKEIAAGRLKNNEEMIRLCRCLYCLEFILNQ